MMTSTGLVCKIGPAVLGHFFLQHGLKPPLSPLCTRARPRPTTDPFARNAVNVDFLDEWPVLRARMSRSRSSDH